MENFVLAVSGGIDSVVLLDMFKWPADTVVAHFNHGIRPSANNDEQFVRSLAQHYSYTFVSEKLPLGANCSEETARMARYAFLKRTATRFDATLVTAHHLDDCIESIAINLLRGTGWRGLTPLNDPAILRPMLDMSKNDIYRYASAHRLAFRLDQSNNEQKYLRNRVREELKTKLTPTKRQALIKLYCRQTRIRVQITDILKQIVPIDSGLSRTFFASVPVDLRCEILRYFLSTQQIKFSRPRLEHCQSTLLKLKNGQKYSIDKKRFILTNKYYYRII